MPNAPATAPVTDDPAPTLGGGATIGTPSKPSIAQPGSMPKNASRLMSELQTLDVDPLPERGAALFVGHLVATVGKDKLESLKKGDVSKMLTSFLHRASLVGQALRVADAVRFSRQLHSFNEPHVDPQEYLRLIYEVLQSSKG